MTTAEHSFSGKELPSARKINLITKAQARTYFDLKFTYKVFNLTYGEICLLYELSIPKRQEIKPSITI